MDIAGAFLVGKITAAGNPDLYQVIVHVGPEALTTDPQPPPDGVPAGTPAPAGRQVGHPAHPRRCHIEDDPALSWNGDKLDLDHAIWVAFANARLTEPKEGRGLARAACDRAVVTEHRA